MLSFYTSYLNRSDRKPKPQIEIKQLAMDAKLEGVEVYPPRLQYMYTNFTDIDGKIYFGMRHIKNVGAKECEKIETLGDVSEYSWIDCITKVIQPLKINKRAAIAMISVGAFNGKKNTESRRKMLYEFDSWKQLSAREQSAIIENQKDPNTRSKTLAGAVDIMIKNTKINSRRMETVVNIKNSLENPFYDLKDHSMSIATQEEKLLGCALTCSKVDDLQMAIDYCEDVAKGLKKKKISLAVVIGSMRVVKTRNGKNPGQEMAFLSVEDNSGGLESVTVFPEAYAE